MSQKDLSGRLARWSLKLQAFDFQIGYRKGSVNVVPDTLSRAFYEETPPCGDDSESKNIVNPGAQSGSHCLPLLLSADSATPTIASLTDSVTVPVLHIDLDSSAFRDPAYLEQINNLNNMKDVDHNFKVHNGKLFIAPSYGNRYLDTDIPAFKLVVPSSLTSQLIEQAHVPPTSAHLGSSKTLERLQRQFFWPQMARQVKEYVGQCTKCKMNKAVNFSTRPNMGNMVVSSRPFQKVFVDFLGPYPRSKRGNSYIVIVVDHFSKFVLVKPLREASASLLCTFLEKEVFLLFSVPEVITSDNGKQFTSHLFKDLLTKYGVSHVRTPVYSPQSNASERVNRTLLSAIRSYIDDHEHSEWDKYLQEVAAALRNSIHDTLHYSPHYLVFGQHISLHGSDYALRKLLCETDANEVQAWSKHNRLNLIKPQIRHYLRIAHDKGARQYNLRSSHRVFCVGQPVFVRSYVLSDASNRFSAKLTARFKPATITSKADNVAYNVQDLEGKPLGIYHTKDIRS